MCFTVQLSMFFAVSDSFDILSCCFGFVKNFLTFFQEVFSFFFDSVASNFDIISQVLFDVNNFFKFFQKLVLLLFSRTELVYNIISFFLCQQLFYFFRDFAFDSVYL